MAVPPRPDAERNTLLLTEQALRRATETWRVLERIDVEKIVRQVAPVAEQLRQAEDQLLRAIRPTLATVSDITTALTPTVQTALERVTKPLPAEALVRVNTSRPERSPGAARSAEHAIAPQCLPLGRADCVMVFFSRWDNRF
jgi:hypothetical protein